MYWVKVNVCTAVAVMNYHVKQQVNFFPLNYSDEI